LIVFKEDVFAKFIRIAHQKFLMRALFSKHSNDLLIFVAFIIRLVKI